MAVEGIISEFADEAAFLWLVRSRVVNEPHFSLCDLAKLDGRLEAHLDGLRVAGEAGWAACSKSLGNELPEAYFAPAVLAFDSGMAVRIKAVLDGIGENPAKARALISALGWLPHEMVQAHIGNLLEAESSFLRYVGIAASAIRRCAPGHHLEKSVQDPDIRLVARGFRAYGELGKCGELKSHILLEGLRDSDDDIRFSSAWSAALAGNSEAVAVLKDFVSPASPYKEKALNLALRRMEPVAALSWQRQLAESSQTIRFAVTGAGIIGDPILIPWLLEQMKTRELARIAGESLTLITGADIDLEELRGMRPERFEAGPNDDPMDCNVAMDADENLPWPNTGAVAQWWVKNQGKFQAGVRHILGAPISVNHLRHVLITGCQRQRAAAALELAFIAPGQPLFEVRGPGFRQQEILRQMIEGL